MLTSTSITLGLLLLSGAIQLIPSQIIPISGMLASNAMTAIGLSYRAMYRSFTDNRQQVFERLSIQGKCSKLASQEILRESIRTGMQPTIDSAKTVGLVEFTRNDVWTDFCGVQPCPSHSLSDYGHVHAAISNQSRICYSLICGL